jgi:hypothetical protein
MNWPGLLLRAISGANTLNCLTAVARTRDSTMGNTSASPLSSGIGVPVFDFKSAAMDKARFENRGLWACC